MAYVAATKVFEWGSIIFLVMQPEYEEALAFDVPYLADISFIDLFVSSVLEFIM